MIWNILAGLLWGAGGLVLLVKLIQSIRLVPTRKAYIVERLGRYHKTLGPGLHPLLPFIDKVAYIQDLREETIEVPPQECFTRDNVRVEVDGVIYISVVNPENASYGVTDYRYAAMQLAQTTTRSVIGTLDLDRTFEEREAINARVVGVLAEVGDAWGIRVHRYEVKNIVPPLTVKDAMERQMAAERDRRALLARAEGQKESMVNESEGRKQELINRSEGEKQRRINEAQGRAEEVLAIARATAESIRKLAAALSVPGGAQAVQLQLSQKYLSKLPALARPDKRVVLPADLSRMDDLLAAVGLDPKAGLAGEVQATAASEAEVANAKEASARVPSPPPIGQVPSAAVPPPKDPIGER